jgi:integrase
VRKKVATFKKRGPYQWQAIVRKRGFPDLYKTFTTKAEAQAWAGQLESEMIRGVFVTTGEAERTTLAEALERYWNEIASKKRHPKQERQRIDRWKNYPLTQNYLTALRGADFAKYRDTRRSEGRAENTIRLELALIAHLYEVARKEWGMEGLANPLKNIRKPSGSIERDRRLKPGEYETIAAELAQSENPWARPLFDLAIETSLRQGMLFELRWEWVDLEQRIINIPRRYRETGNKGVPGTLPLTSKATEVLKSLPRSIDGQVFPTTANALRCVWKRALKRLNITGLRWHDLRHEASSRFFEKGLNPMQVASITGHKNLNMLRRDTHLQAVDLVKMLG